MNYIILNGVNSNTITGLIIQELPPISKPLMRTQIDQIDGRDGDIVTKLGYSTVDKELSIGLHGNFNIDSVIEYFASEGTVIFSNEPDKYYRYQVLEQIDFERLVRFRTATVTMHCQPFKYEVNEDPIEEAGSTDTTGDIVSFETQSADAVGVKVNVEPYQNLNGYANPWVGGAGKNLLPITISSQTYHGITLTVNANGSVTVNGTASELTIFILTSSLALPDGTYVINGCPSGGGSSTYRLDVNGGSIGQDTGGSATFNVSGGTGISNVRLRIASGYTVNNLVFWPMIRIAGESNTFEPYENICPIYPANGKNLLPTFSNEGTTRGVTFTLGDNGTVIANGTATNVGDASKYIIIESGTIPTGKYKFNGCAIGGSGSSWNVYMWDETANSRAKKWDNSTNSVDCYSPEQWQEVYIDSSHRYQYVMRVKSLVTADNIVFNPMVYPSEIADSLYVPYNAIGITRAGKNLFDKNKAKTSSRIRTTDGVMEGTNSSFIASDYIRVAPNTVYCNNFTYASSANYGMAFYDKDFLFISGLKQGTVSGMTDFLFTTPNNCAYLRFSAYITNTPLDSLQMEVGNHSTSYEPYTAERYYPISDNPVYGGTLDVTTGLLTLTHKGVDLGSLTYKGDPAVPRFYTTQLAQEIKYPPNNEVVSGSISSLYREVTFEELYARYKEDGTMAVGSTGTLSIIDRRYPVSDANAYKTAVTGQMFVYPLATPLVYQLTPVQVKTLLGYNNIWTDSGTVTVSVPNMISVVNEGNTIAKPTMTIYGTGNIGVWLNGMQVFQIALGDTGNITIDAEQMEAYQGGILRNRLVTGDYSNFVLQKGENTISVTGNVTNVEITNYSRWL